MGSTSGLVEGLFGEVTGSEEADCKVTVWERTGFEVIICEETEREDTIQGTVCDDEALFAGLFWDLLKCVETNFNLSRT